MSCSDTSSTTIDVKDVLKKHLSVKNTAHIHNQEICIQLGKERERIKHLELVLQSAKEEIQNRDHLIDKVIKKNENLESQLENYGKSGWLANIRHLCFDRYIPKPEYKEPRQNVQQKERRNLSKKHQKNHAEKLRGMSNQLGHLKENKTTLASLLDESKVCTNMLQRELKVKKQKFDTVCEDLNERKAELNQLRCEYEDCERAVRILKDALTKAKKVPRCPSFRLGNKCGSGTGRNLYSVKWGGPKEKMHCQRNFDRNPCDTRKHTNYGGKWKCTRIDDDCQQKTMVRKKSILSVSKLEGSFCSKTAQNFLRNNTFSQKRNMNSVRFKETSNLQENGNFFQEKMNLDCHDRNVQSNFNSSQRRKANSSVRGKSRSTENKSNYCQNTVQKNLNRNMNVNIKDFLLRDDFETNDYYNRVCMATQNGRSFPRSNKKYPCLRVFADNINICNQTLQNDIAGLLQKKEPSQTTNELDEKVCPMKMKTIPPSIKRCANENIGTNVPRNSYISRRFQTPEKRLDYSLLNNNRFKNSVKNTARSFNRARICRYRVESVSPFRQARQTWKEKFRSFSTPSRANVSHLKPSKNSFSREKYRTVAPQYDYAKQSTSGRAFRKTLQPCESDVEIETNVTNLTINGARRNRYQNRWVK